MQNSESDLITQEIRGLLENVLVDLSVAKYTIAVTQGATIGDNFLGVIAKAVVNGHDTNSDEEVCLNFIIKSAPRQGMFRNLGPLRQAYEREIYVYRTILPILQRFQKERDIEDSFVSYAKFYNSNMENLNEALIMQDMKSIGFQLLNRSEPLNYDHALLVMREYGRFHALSFALREQEPETFKNLTQDLGEYLFKSWRDNADINKAIKSHNQRAVNAFDPIRDELVYNRVKNFNENCLEIVIPLLDAETAGKYSVIGHSDCWINNLLFKYDDPTAPSKPTHLCLLDWQLTRLGSPALDLSYFLFTCTDKSLRDVHYDDLIREYYRSFSKFLYDLGSDSSSLFPFEILQEHLKQFSLYGLFMGIMVLHFMLSETDEIPDLHNIKYEDMEAVHEVAVDTKNIVLYHNRIRDVVLDFIKFNYDL